MSDPKMWDGVTVSWIDAVTRHGPNNAKQYAKEFKPVLRHSIGYYIGKSGGYIHISATDDRPSREYDNADYITSIPMGMVVEVTVLGPQGRPEPELQNKPL